MRFGVHYLTTYLPESDGMSQEFYAHLFEQIHAAEELGFDDAWVTEHHFHEFGGLIPSPPGDPWQVPRLCRRERCPSASRRRAVLAELPASPLRSWRVDVLEPANGFGVPDSGRAGADHRRRPRAVCRSDPAVPRDVSADGLLRPVSLRRHAPGERVAQPAAFRRAGHAGA
jgi:hypothetical protein